MGGAVFAPILARGMSNNHVIAAMEPGNLTAITVDDLTGLVLGAHVFVGNNDYSLAEYLGPVVSRNVGTKTIYCPFEPRRVRQAGNTLWTPTSFWQAASTLGPSDVQPGYDNGTEYLDTTSDVPLATRVRKSRESRRWEWKAKASDFRGYQAFERDVLQGGIRTFTAAWFDQVHGALRTCKVKLADADRPRPAVLAARVLAKWSFELLVIAEDAYL